MVLAKVGEYLDSTSGGTYWRGMVEGQWIDDGSVAGWHATREECCEAVDEVLRSRGYTI